MDQWANWRFDSEYGEVFVSVSRAPFPGATPDAYDEVNTWTELRPRDVRGSAISDFKEHFRWVQQHQSMVFGQQASFSQLVSYVQGVDDATGFLDGFHRWLVERLGGGGSLYWSRLVEFDYFETEPVHHSHDLPDGFSERVEAADSALMDHFLRCSTTS